MRVGELTKRIVFETATETPDGSGGATVVWGLSLVRWAKIAPLDGTEDWRQKQLMPTLSHTITIRYVAGIVPTMRIVHGSRVFKILSVLDVNEAKRELRIMAEEIVQT